MADEKEPESGNVDSAKDAGVKPSPPRKIPGNLPYLVASGTLRRALEGLIDASRPDKFNADFLENVLKLTGGAARATIPIMKKMEFLSSDGTPTELYAKFRTDSSRPAAAFAALRNGFPEIFKRSEYAHTVDDNKIRDIILEITGLKATDPVAKAIKSTFSVIKSFIPYGANFSNEADTTMQDDPAIIAQNEQAAFGRNVSQEGKSVGLVYNINIVLPETSDLKVLNAIFRSVKENLL
jgi:hypothetical protein